MKKPELEVIRFDEADIITSSGMGFTADYFGNEKQNDGIFSFFGGTGSVTSVRTGDSDNAILAAFNSYFDGGWESTDKISVSWSNGEESWSENLQGIIDKERRYDSRPDELTNHSKYIGTYYYYGKDGFRSN